MPMGYYYGYDYTWYLLVLPAFLLALWAQFRVKATYSKYSKVRSVRGRTAAEVARQILNDHGLSYVQVDQIGGELTDNYDPRTNIVHLSQGVYSSTSIAAIGVAAHECGHAVQHAEDEAALFAARREEYSPLKLRSAIIPITNIGSSLSIPIFFIGLLFNYTLLMNIGILLFGLVALFQLITLPVEFNASRRALATIEERALLTEDEARGAKKVLSAAALTYVAALASTLAQLLRLIIISRGNRRN